MIEGKFRPYSADVTLEKEVENTNKVEFFVPQVSISFHLGKKILRDLTIFSSFFRHHQDIYSYISSVRYKLFPGLWLGIRNGIRDL